MIYDPEATARLLHLAKGLEPDAEKSKREMIWLLESGQANPNSGEGGAPNWWTPIFNSLLDIEVFKAFLEAGVDPSIKDYSDWTVLHLCCHDNDRKIEHLKAAIEAGCDLDAKIAVEGSTALHIAVKRTDTEKMIEALLEAGASLTERDASGRTVLEVAIEKHLPMIRRFIARKMDGTQHGDIQLLEAKSKDDLGADLIHAVRIDDLPSVKKCLEAGADPNVQSWQGETPLFMAISMNKPESVKALLKAGADPDTQYLQRAPLHYAARCSFIEIVEELLEANADPFALNGDGETPIEEATMPAHEQVRNLIRKAISDRMARTQHGDITLLEAKSKGNDLEDRLFSAIRTDDLPLVKELIEAGADVNAKTQWNWAPLHVAARANELEIVKVLLKAGADPDVKSSAGMTALHYATKCNFIEMIGELLKAKADPFALNDGGETPLDQVTTDQARDLIRKVIDQRLSDAQHGDIPLLESAKDLGAELLDVVWKSDRDSGLLRVKELIKAGADVNVGDNLGLTALHFAADIGSIEILRDLIEAGADVNLRDTFGRTPLHLASVSSRIHNVEIAAELIRAGADPLIADNNGRSPLDNAKGRIKQLIEEAIKDRMMKGIQYGDIHLLESSDPDADRVGSLASQMYQMLDERRLDDLKEFLEEMSSPTMTRLILVRAIGNDDVEAARAIISTGYSDPDGGLGIAHYVKSPEMVQLVAESGLDMNSQDPQGNTPLRTVVDLTMAHEDKAAVIKTLIGAGGDPNLSDNDGLTALHRALLFCQPSNPASRLPMEALIDGGADLDAKTNKGWTPLHTATWMQNIEAVRILIRSGADLFVQDANGRTPLEISENSHSWSPEIKKQINDILRAEIKRRMQGTQHGDISLAESANIDIGSRILDLVNMNKKDDLKAFLKKINDPKWTAYAVDWCVLRDNAMLLRMLVDELGASAKESDDGEDYFLTLSGPNVIPILVEAGADVNVRDPARDGKTPLWIAVELKNNTKEKYARIKALLEAGADHAIQDTKCDTVLHVAAIKNDVEAIRLLVGAGAEINIRGSVRKNTPLHDAVMFNRHEAVDALLALGADPFITNASGKTSRQIAEETPGMLRMFEEHMDRVMDGTQHGDIQLVESSRDLNAALRVAASNGDIIKVNAFLAAGADPSAAVGNDWTAIGLAAWSGSDLCVRSLLKAGADIDATFNKGLSVLHAVALAPHQERDHSKLAECVKIFVEAGSDVDLKDDGGWTPLMTAVRSGAPSVQFELLKHGADPLAEDRFGLTPFKVTDNKDLQDAMEKVIKERMEGIQHGDIQLVEAAAEDLQELFFEAIRSNDLNIVRSMIKGGIDIHSKNDEGNAPLHVASHYDRPEIVRELIEAGADIELKNSFTNTPLGVAVEQRQYDVAAELIQAGANVNTQNIFGNTPLHHAMHINHLGIVRLLIHSGADLSLKNANGQMFLDITGNKQKQKQFKTEVQKIVSDIMSGTQHGDIPLLESKGSDLGKKLLDAAEAGNLATVEKLIKSGADLKANDYEGWTALHYATRQGHLEVVKVLIAAGTDLEAKDDDGETALHHASFKNHLEVVKFLVEVGLDLESKDNTEWTALHYASSQGHLEIVKFLVEAGVDLEVKNNDGWTALHHALSQGHPKVVKVLIEAGADLFAIDNRGKTALEVTKNDKMKSLIQKAINDRMDGPQHGDIPLLESMSGATDFNFKQAIKRNNIEEVRRMIAKGIDVNARTQDDWSALHEASFLGHAEIVKELIKAGADVDTLDQWGATPLNRAVQSRQDEVVDELIASGADVSVKFDIGNSLLHIAANSNADRRIVDKLLESGIEVDVRNHWEWTPLHTAADNGSTDVAERLIERGADVFATNKDGLTPLDLCQEDETRNMITEFIAKRMEGPQHGDIPLVESASHDAVEAGDTKLLHKLLDDRADPNEKNDAGETVMDIAIRKGDARAIAITKSFKGRSSGTQLRKMKARFSGDPDMISSVQGSGSWTYNSDDVVVFSIWYGILFLKDSSSADEVTHIELFHMVDQALKGFTPEDASHPKIVKIIEENLEKDAIRWEGADSTRLKDLLTHLRSNKAGNLRLRDPRDCALLGRSFLDLAVVAFHAKTSHLDAATVERVIKASDIDRKDAMLLFMDTKESVTPDEFKDGSFKALSLSKAEELKMLSKVHTLPTSPPKSLLGGVKPNVKHGMTPLQRHRTFYTSESTNSRPEPGATT